MENNNPTVFISYSHDDDMHKNWVLKLSSDLRSHGVNVILDQWNLRIGEDLRFFMENGLSKSSLVLCICSTNYVNKFNEGKGGVGYESSIMTLDLLKSVNYNYIIPIVRNNDLKIKVPRALGSKLYIDFSNDSLYLEKYIELLERIYGEDLNKKPPLGQNPFNHKIASNIEIRKNIEFIKYHSPEMDGNITFNFANNDGCYSVGTGEYLIKTRWSRAGNNSIYAYGYIGFKYGIYDFPSLNEIEHFDFSSSCRTLHTGEIIIFKNEFNNFVAIKLGEVKSSSHGFPYDEMIFDYHIYK